MSAPKVEEEMYRILVLGAGFSKAAGYPLADELWTEILKRAIGLHGRAAKFWEDIESYVEYKHSCGFDKVSRDNIDFEDFCRFLDIEHALGLRGSDTWSEDGNEGTIVIKNLIGQVLTDATRAMSEVPQVYRHFAERLGLKDVVLTFNYDVLLERALDEVGKPYRMFPSRYESVGEFGGVLDTTKDDEVMLLKLHGSIDWFDRSSYLRRTRNREEAGLTGLPEDLIFGDRRDELRITKLLDGPRPPDDPLGEIYRVREVERLYEESLLFRATPWLLAPSTMKILYANKLADFWYGMGGAAVRNLGLAIIGYSLPSQDAYAHQAIHSLVTNYQGNYWGEEILPGRKKTPLAIVGHCNSDEEINKLKTDTYRFVQWDRAVGYYAGFDEASLDLIFSSS